MDWPAQIPSPMEVPRQARELCKILASQKTQVPGLDPGPPSVVKCVGASQNSHFVNSGHSLGFLAATFATLLLAACSDADTDPAAPEPPAPAITAPTPPAVPNPGDIISLTRDDFAAALAPDYLAANMDSDDAETALQSWLDAADAEEGNTATSLRKRFEADGRTVLIATASGLADDSVAAQQIYAEFTPIGPLSNALDFAGARLRCARGADTTDWQMEPCP